VLLQGLVQVLGQGPVLARLGLVLSAPPSACSGWLSLQQVRQVRAQDQDQGQVQVQDQGQD